MPYEQLNTVLTLVFGLQVGILKMTSNDKMLNIKVVRLIETSNFVFWVIAIRASMQNLEPKYCRNTPGQYRGRPTLDSVCPGRNHRIRLARKRHIFVRLL